MKNKKVILTVLAIVIVLAGVYVQRVFTEDNNTISYKYTTTENTNTSVNGKLSKNYAHADVQGIKGNAVTKAASDESLPEKTRHSKSTGAHALVNSNTTGSLPYQSGNNVYSDVNSTGQYQNSKDFTQSVNPSSNVGYKPVTIGAVRAISTNNVAEITNGSGTNNNSTPMQKAGEKPGEPGLGTLPVGDGVWILILLTLIYGGWKYQKFSMV